MNSKVFVLDLLSRCFEDISNNHFRIFLSLCLNRFQLDIVLGRYLFQDHTNDLLDIQYPLFHHLELLYLSLHSIHILYYSIYKMFLKDSTLQGMRLIDLLQIYFLDLDIKEYLNKPPQ